MRLPKVCMAQIMAGAPLSTSIYCSDFLSAIWFNEAKKAVNSVKAYEFSACSSVTETRSQLLAEFREKTAK